MKYLSSQELRQAFIDFFAKENDHQWVASSSLVPESDPTLLFVNAGMVQFKQTFLGTETRSYKRAVSVQRCVRAGGKHNDLDEVGYTARHHTFFEMLGNFSFGDYFKREAIKYSWKFLTEILKLPQERLWVTVFHDDPEAEKIWLEEMGIDPQRFSRCGEKDNFWSMGDTGPCGPCSEIFYDHGPEIAGGPPGSPDQEGDRYVEIWNLVFMQYDRSSDGKLTPLPNQAVDTGMGLERLAAVVQGVHNNYETDIFTSIITAIEELLPQVNDNITSKRVIADHIRSCSALIVDGVIPSNEGRGYVLRRIIRRAIRHGHHLGISEIFFYQLVSVFAELMGEAYPGLQQKKNYVATILEQEENQFIKTLDQGLKLLSQEISELNDKVIPGELVFKLYDTYRLPPDLTADVAREQGLHIDEAGFEAAMATQRNQSQAASKFKVVGGQQLTIDGHSDFTGYTETITVGHVIALFRDDQEVAELKVGDNGMVVLDKTPFYAESGGQVGDTGQLFHDDNCFKVEDTQRYGDAICHFGELQFGTLRMGQEITASIDVARRKAIKLNHSATHLLHAALRQVLGEHVTQKGSLVDGERLRFDFSHFAAMTSEELAQVETQVNEKIRESIGVKTTLMDPEQAKAHGAMALFGEKYGDTVRVLQMGDFSIELCGGTHVTNTGEIGLFKIANETGIAAGVRRIEAVTGAQAIEWFKSWQQLACDAATLLKASPENLLTKLEQLIQQEKQNAKQIKKLQSQLASGSGGDLSEQAKVIAGVKLLVHQFEDVEMDFLRQTMDQLKSKLGSAVILLAEVNGEKVQLVAGVTKDYTDKFHAGQLVNHVASQIGGKGGGRPDMAQAGGDDPTALVKALGTVETWLRQQVG